MKKYIIISALLFISIASYGQSALTYKIIKSLDRMYLRANSPTDSMELPRTRGVGEGGVMRLGANGKFYVGTPDSLGGGTETPLDTICLDYCNGCTADTGLIIVNGCFIFDTIGGACGVPVISGDTIFYCGDTIVPITSSELWVKSGSKIFPKSSNWNVGIGMANPLHKLHVEGNLFGNGAGHFEGGNGNVNGAGGLNATDALLMARYAAGIIPWFNGIIEGDLSGNTNIGKLDADLVTAVSVGSKTLAQARQLGRFLDGNQHSPLMDTTLLVWKGLSVQGYGNYLALNANPNSHVFNVLNDKVGADSLFTVDRAGDVAVGLAAPSLGKVHVLANNKNGIYSESNRNGVAGLSTATSTFSGVIGSGRYVGVSGFITYGQLNAKAAGYFQWETPSHTGHGLEVWSAEKIAKFHSGGSSGTSTDTLFKITRKGITARGYTGDIVVIADSTTGSGTVGGNFLNLTRLGVSKWKADMDGNTTQSGTIAAYLPPLAGTADSAAVIDWADGRKLKMQKLATGTGSANPPIYDSLPNGDIEITANRNDFRIYGLNQLYIESEQDTTSASINLNGQTIRLRSDQNYSGNGSLVRIDTTSIFIATATLDLTMVDTILGLEGYMGNGTSGTSLKQTVTQNTHGFSVGDAIYHNGTIYAKAQADDATSAAVIGIVDSVIGANDFEFQYGGIYTHGEWTNGTAYFLSPATAGLIVTEPIYTAGEVRQYVGMGTPSGLLLEIDLGQVIADNEFADVDTTAIGTQYDLTLKQNVADTNTKDATRYWVGQQGFSTQYDIATMTLPISRVTALQDSLSAKYTKTQADNKFVAKADIVKQLWIGVDTTAINTSDVYFMGYSDGFVIDSLIFHQRRVAGSPDVTCKIWYGSDINAAGTAVVTAGNQINSYAGATRVSTFNNATVAKGNAVWLTFSAVATRPKGFFVTIIGHKQ